MPRSSAVGAVVRRAREQRGMSQLALARACAISQGFLSRLESGEASPRWSTLEVIGAAIGLEPCLTFIRDPAGRAAMIRRLEHMSLVDRVLAQPVDIYSGLECFARGTRSYAVTGVGGALLHGLALAVDSLHVLLLDEDDNLMDFGHLLSQTANLWEEYDPDLIRRMNGRTWLLGMLGDGPPPAEARVDIVEELPETVDVPVDESLTVCVESMTTLTSHPAVVHALESLIRGAATDGE